MSAANHSGFAGPDIIDQLCFAGYVFQQDCVSETCAVRFVGVAAAKTGQVVLFGQSHGAHVGIGIFTGVVSFHKVKLAINVSGDLVSECAADTQKFFTAGMSRSDGL